MEFTQWEWGQLAPAQKHLYRDMMLRTWVSSKAAPAAALISLVFKSWGMSEPVR